MNFSAPNEFYQDEGEIPQSFFFMENPKDLSSYNVDDLFEEEEEVPKQKFIPVETPLKTPPMQPMFSYKPPPVPFISRKNLTSIGNVPGIVYNFPLNSELVLIDKKYCNNLFKQFDGLKKGKVEIDLEKKDLQKQFDELSNSKSELKMEYEKLKIKLKKKEDAFWKLHDKNNTPSELFDDEIDPEETFELPDVNIEKPPSKPFVDKKDKVGMRNLIKKIKDSLEYDNLSNPQKKAWDGVYDDFGNEREKGWNEFFYRLPPSDGSIFSDDEKKKFQSKIDWYKENGLKKPSFGIFSADFVNKNGIQCRNHFNDNCKKRKRNDNDNERNNKKRKF